MVFAKYENTVIANGEAIVLPKVTEKVDYEAELGFVIGTDKSTVPVQRSFLTTPSVLYDAVYVPGGVNSTATLEADPDAIHFLDQAFKHCKAIAADADALQVLRSTYFGFS